MTLPKNVAELQGENVVFELECIDRMYLNLYVPQLASAPGVAAYFRGYKGHRFASTKEAVAMSEGFRRQVLDFAERKATPIIRFEKGMRKDDVMHKRLRKFKAREGVVFIGIAQEKARVPRTIRKGFGEGEGTIPWIDYTTAMVNHYYFYCVDEDFGPFFIKFCSYFPYTGKLCINGHEYLNGQLARRGIEFEALDNGLLRCADPAAAQRIAEAFDEKKIERFFRKWLSVLPHPYPAADRKAGFRYRLSVAGGVFPHSDLGSPAAREAIFRGSHPGEHRFGPTRNGAVDLRAQNAQVDCRRRPMQDAHSYRRGHPFAARLLQKHAPQAVSQDGRARCGPAYRNHH